MSTLPMVVPALGLPEQVTIYEVGPRDGLQNESTVVPLGVKADFVQRLLDAGLPGGPADARHGCRAAVAG
jgi:hydroxymethylglutaryl-CoA lyase